MIRPKPHIAAHSVYGLAEMSIAPGKRLISLAQNESPFPLSPLAAEAAREALAAAPLYPDPSCAALRAAIAKVHGLKAEEVICSAGSMELIAALIAAFAGPGDEVLTSAHAYSYFRTAALAVGARPVLAPEKAITLDVDALLARVTPATRIVAVANPGNPSGTRVSGAELRRLHVGLPEDVILLIDEAYAEFAPDDPVFDLTEAGNVCVTRTFSKAYAMAGLRVGWGVFPKGIGDEIWKLLNPGGVAAPSLAAAEAAVRDQAHMRGIVRETARLLDGMIADLTALGLKVAPSHTNFALIEMASPEDALSADAALRAEGVVLRPMGGYDLPHCLRMTVGVEEDMAAALSVLKTWVEARP